MFFTPLVDLRNEPDTTSLKAVWIAVDVEGTPANTVINETKVNEVRSIPRRGRLLHFELRNEDVWSRGKYKVDIYLNDKLDKTLTFEVR